MPFVADTSSCRDFDRDIALRSFEDVGKTKAIGYLPLSTIRKVLNEKVPKLAKTYEARGLGARVFSVRQTCIKSGALFVFDGPAVQAIVDQYGTEIARMRWKPDVSYIVRKLARDWYDDDHAIMPFIKDLYGDR